MYCRYRRVKKTRQGNGKRKLQQNHKEGTTGVPRDFIYLRSILSRKGLDIAQSRQTPLLFFTYVIAVACPSTIWLTAKNKTELLLGCQYKEVSFLLLFFIFFDGGGGGGVC